MIARIRSLLRRRKINRLSPEEFMMRMVRGAQFCGATLDQLVEALEVYVQDKSACDRQPLMGWWNLGSKFNQEAFDRMLRNSRYPINKEFS